MYLPASFAETDPATLAGLIAEHPLGLLITAGSSGLLASPLPFLYRLKDGQPMLVAHRARANAHWRDLAGSPECLIVFQGDDSYITPNWYATKQATGRSSPPGTTPWCKSAACRPSSSPPIGSANKSAG